MFVLLRLGHDGLLSDSGSELVAEGSAAARRGAQRLRRRALPRRTRARSLGAQLAHQRRSAAPPPRPSSSAVLPRPRPKRTAQRASASGRPSARSTWLGSPLRRGAGRAGGERDLAQRRPAARRPRRPRSRRSGSPAAARSGGRCGARPAARARAATSSRRAGPRAAAASAAQLREAELDRAARSPRSAAPAACRAAGPARGRRRAAAARARTRGRPAPHVERADALRPVELVRAEREQVDAQRATSSGSLPTACAASLCSSTPRSRQTRPIAVERLQHADLAVRRHHRDEQRARRRARAATSSGIDAGPRASTGSRVTAEALRLERAAGVEHGGVLGRDGDR